MPSIKIAFNSDHWRNPSRWRETFQETVALSENKGRPAILFQTWLGKGTSKSLIDLDEVERVLDTLSFVAPTVAKLNAAKNQRVRQVWQEDPPDFLEENSLAWKVLESMKIEDNTLFIHFTFMSGFKMQAIPAKDLEEFIEKIRSLLPRLRELAEENSDHFLAL